MRSDFINDLANVMTTLDNHSYIPCWYRENKRGVMGDSTEGKLGVGTAIERLRILCESQRNAVDTAWRLLGEYESQEVEVIDEGSEPEIETCEPQCRKGD